MADNRKTVVICHLFFWVICMHDETGPDRIKLTIGVRALSLSQLSSQRNIDSNQANPADGEYCEKHG